MIIEFEGQHCRGWRIGNLSHYLIQQKQFDAHVLHEAHFFRSNQCGRWHFVKVNGSNPNRD